MFKASCKRYESVLCTALDSLNFTIRCISLLSEVTPKRLYLFFSTEMVKRELTSATQNSSQLKKSCVIILAMNAMDEVIKLFYNIQVALSSIQSPEKLVVRARSSVPLLSFSPAKEEKKTLNPKILYVYPKNIKYRDLVLSERPSS